MRVQIELAADFGEAVCLSEIAKYRRQLRVHGIYVITEGKPTGEVLDPSTPEVVYIGKAIKQTVHGRCVRHVQSVLDARSSKSGKPLSGPGHSFKLYRERINFDPSVLWVTPGVMSSDLPYAISCAEEYLLHHYWLKHSRYPWCNTAGQDKHLEPGIGHKPSRPRPIPLLEEPRHQTGMIIQPAKGVSTVEAIVHGNGKYYKDGTELMHLHLRKRDAHGLPTGDGAKTPVTIVARRHTYTGMMNARAGYDYLFVSPSLTDETGEGHKLAHLFAQWGLVKGGRVLVSVTGTRLTLDV